MFARHVEPLVCSSLGRCAHCILTTGLVVSGTPVSDFGMSAALVGGQDDSDYAANYVKLGGEVGAAAAFH